MPKAAINCCYQAVADKVGKQRKKEVSTPPAFRCFPSAPYCQRELIGVMWFEESQP